MDSIRCGSLYMISLGFRCIYATIALPVELVLDEIIGHWQTSVEAIPTVNAQRARVPDGYSRVLWVRVLDAWRHLLTVCIPGRLRKDNIA